MSCTNSSCAYGPSCWLPLLLVRMMTGYQVRGAYSEVHHSDLSALLVSDDAFSLPHSTLLAADERSQPPDASTTPVTQRMNRASAALRSDRPAIVVRFVNNTGPMHVYIGAGDSRDSPLFVYR